jgi:spore maturation protein CgeB
MPRVFGVDYQFLSCGDVFTQGLVHAAEALGITYAHCEWNDPDLDVLLQQCNPDLLFVVHGRRFCARWQGGGLNRSALCQTAVWLLDEPYEVDETSQWSKHFDHVFINDPSTLPRHHHATYLPVCYDPVVHAFGTGPRPYDVGFIGGGNTTRDRYLSALVREGLLSYVVGGAWSDAGVNRLCRSPNIRPAVTANWYQQTRIVLNVFREIHHFNNWHTAATSLNPRVYEALACGALVVSEWRPEVETLIPELPTFKTEAECVALIRSLLADPQRAEVIRQQCRMRISLHTYAARLRTVMATCRIGQAVTA